MKAICEHRTVSEFIALICFFFQAEDGIRGFHVTGVQTCALPIYSVRFDRIWGREEPQRFVIGADLSVFEDGRPAGRLDPRLNFYRSSEQPLTTPAVRKIGRASCRERRRVVGGGQREQHRSATETR